VAVVREVIVAPLTGPVSLSTLPSGSYVQVVVSFFALVAVSTWPAAV
jgi:hypothetical protein